MAAATGVHAGVMNSQLNDVNSNLHAHPAWTARRQGPAPDRERFAG
ncbi:hypothetical protein [Sphingobacterium daejeonense]|nr:hypothetical protein [Sphingobacterium daejeonense]